MKNILELKKILLGAVKPVSKLSVSDWADNYRVISEGNAEPGQWRTSRVPYMRSVMDSFTQPGIHKVVVKSSSQVGKALDVETLIPTPTGFKKMLDIQTGDEIFDETGKICNVIATSEIFYNHKCFEVEFSDGAKIIADSEHNWFVHDDLSGHLKKKILSTEEISKDFKVGKRNRYAIPIAKAMQLPEQDLPIDPYTLGCWLGDGNSYSAQLTLHKDDIEIAKRVESAGHKIIIRPVKNNILNIQIDPKEIHKNICIRDHDMNKVGRTKRGYCAECSRQYAMVHKWKGKRDIKMDPIVNLPEESLHLKLLRLNVLQNKHIPEIYLRSSIAQRMELLRGLMDTDGTISVKGGCSFDQKNKTLALQAAELLRSLGFKPSVKKRQSSCIYKGERKFSEVFEVFFLAYEDKSVFHLARKKARLKNREDGSASESFRRRIISVREVESRPTKCIAVDSPSHLYLAGENFIPTHNSEVLMNVIGRFAQLDPGFMMIIQPTLEMAQDFSKSRLDKMVEDCKSLTPLFYGEEKAAKSRNKNQTMLSKFFKGGRLVLAGANSAAGLASRPVRILLCDEVDRFPESATGNEGDPVDLAQKRMTTFWNYCMGLFSTPTIEGISRIDLEYTAGTQEQWQHKCPSCGEFHKLDYINMKCDYEMLQNQTGKIVIMKSVVWQCPDCGMEFSEREIKNAEQKYVAQNPDALKNGVRSFWVNTFSSPWLSWKDIMREWFEAKGNPSREKVVMNTRFGECYRMTGEYEDENEFMRRREVYEAEIPLPVKILTCAVDVQQNRLEYEVAGWNDAKERWGIQRGVIKFAPTDENAWTTLDAVLEREYFKIDGTSLKIARTFIDSGYSTDNVYRYCQSRQFKGVFPIKGMGTAGLPLIYKITPTNGMALFILGVNEGKSAIYSRLGIEEVGVKYMHYPVEDGNLARGYDEVYFKELISEKRVIRQRNGIAYVGWEKTSREVRNESLDLCVYNLACVQGLIGAKREAKRLPKRRTIGF